MARRSRQENRDRENTGDISMDALILAGGLGTRLRPITHTRPKPLLPVMNRPMIARIIDSLPPGTDRVVLAVNYKKEYLDRYFREHDFGLEIVIVNEEEPLGTGGAIKNCEEELGDEFMVFNGDVISSLPVPEIVSSFRRTGSMGTIALWEVNDPARFGLVRMDVEDGNRVKAFIEKPSLDGPGELVRPFLINAGVYVLRKEILDYMDRGVKTSMEREVFPVVLKEHRLSGFPFTGYWVDSGTRESYIEAHRKIFKYAFRKEYPGAYPGRTVFGENCQIHPEAKIVPPVLTGDGCVIENAVVGPCVCLGDGVRISEEVRIAYSVAHDGAKIMRRSVVQDSIMGERSVLHSGALSNAIVGDDEERGREQGKGKARTGKRQGKNRKETR